MGRLRNLLSEGILGPFMKKGRFRNQFDGFNWTGTSVVPMGRTGFDGGAFRRRLRSWMPTQYTTNVIMASSGALLRARCRDVLRNNPHANAACDSYVANVVGTGIKPSSLFNEDPNLRAAMQRLWLDWTDESDADGLCDFYGLQTMVARALFESGEVFIRFRNRKVEDGYLVPLQIQLLESDMCPYHWNQFAPNGNYIMNGVEFDFRGQRVAYWFHPQHPGDMPIDINLTGLYPVRVPASEVLHIFKPQRPGQVRGVPLITPALVRLFFLDQYDDAELERKRIAAMFAGFVTSAVPEDIVPVDGVDTTSGQDGIGLTGLEPGTLQTLLPGEDIKFSEPADVGGSYEAYQYRQQLAVFSGLGIPYSLGTSDLRRANYSSLRGSIVEYRRKLEQTQHNVFVFQMCRPVWQRWLDTAVLAEALPVPVNDYLLRKSDYSRTKWIPQRNDWVDPLKDRQAEKLAVDSGFKSRSDVIEAEGYDPEENDQRIAADQERAEQLDIVIPVVYASPTQPTDPAAEQAQQDAAEQAAADAADNESDAA
jgi:lambda family phage portal protein